MRGWWQDLTDLVLPAECGGCGRPRTVLCPECRAVLSGAVPRRVRPVPEPPGLPVVHAVARYADEVRAVLLAHKERGALALAAPLGTALAGAVRAGLRVAGRPADGVVTGLREARGPADSAGLREARGLVDAAGGGQGAAGGGGGVVMLVPVPSSRAVVRSRGHDPARRIALAAAGELRRAGTPARVVSVLRQSRAVADQAGLNHRQRLENLAGALVVVPGGGRLLSGGRVVLVDDLMTTGASLAEAARAVRAAMAEQTAMVEQTVAGGGAAGARAVVVSGADVCGEGATAVYGTVRREGRGERMGGATEEETGRVAVPSGTAGVGGDGDAICAAVVAATPDSFEINRN
ncbi:ComF family protein [Streptomyces sp. NBC_01352]|uniref:ComF family protein n=1 Tax=Streptomyces sp. NBC_01352 TaxID=2903834 RepID=UPI002E330036|nr:ComF family protein [Streptomyces sp. NBC_01352]